MGYVFLFGLVALGGLFYYSVTCDVPENKDDK